MMLLRKSCLGKVGRSVRGNGPATGAMVVLLAMGVVQLMTSEAMSQSDVRVYRDFGVGPVSSAPLSVFQEAVLNGQVTEETHDVKGLVVVHETKTGKLADPAPLIKAIKATIAPHSWEKSGSRNSGLGMIEYCEKDSTIEVVNSTLVHEALKKYLEQRLQAKADGKVAAKHENFELAFDGKSSCVELPFSYDGSHPITIDIIVTPLMHHPLDMQKSITGCLETIIGDTEAGGLELGVDPRKIGVIALCGQWYAKAESKGCRIGWARIHLSATLDNNELRFYENGRLLAKSTGLAPFRGSKYGFLIGASPHPNHSFPEGIQRPFHGCIDEVRISKVNRYKDNFAPIYRYETDGDTLALYHFDEGDGKIARDSSGNNRHGKILGATWQPVK